MEPRERLLTTLRRRVPDRVPKSMSLCPSQMERFRLETGAESPADYFGFDSRGVSPLPVRNDVDFRPYHADLPPEARLDHWGIGWVKDAVYHFERILHPLQRAKTVREIVDYPYPDLAADYRFVGFETKIAEIHARGLAAQASVSPVGGTVFWPAYKMRGMAELLMDLAADPEMAFTLLDVVTDICTRLAAKLATYDLDILNLADDLGTQRALMVRPADFRIWFKERLRTVIDAAKSVKPDILVVFHSDGKIDAIIPDLIEIGVDVLNPLQPEVMDPAAIKREFGQDLAFWGGLGTQTTLPFGTVAEVRSTVKTLIDTVGEGGGFVIAPTHLVEPEVPWENIMAFVETVNEYGVYA
jgi:uroporphyrinogen decarboxylase